MEELKKEIAKLNSRLDSIEEALRLLLVRETIADVQLNTGVNSSAGLPIKYIRKKDISVDDRVRIKSGSSNYFGGSLSEEVFSETWIVSKTDGQKITLKNNSGNSLIVKVESLENLEMEKIDEPDEKFEEESTVKEQHDDKELSNQIDICNDYFLEYNNLVNEMITNNNNGEKIIEIFKKILNQYNGILAMDYKRIFESLPDNIALVMLMNKEIKNYFCEKSMFNVLELNENSKRNSFSFSEKNLKTVFRRIKNLTNEAKISKSDSIHWTGSIKIENPCIIISESCYGWSNVRFLTMLKKDTVIKYDNYSYDAPEPLWAIEIDEEIYNAPLLNNLPCDKENKNENMQNHKIKTSSLFNAIKNGNIAVMNEFMNNLHK